MGAVRVASDVALCAFARILTAEGKHIAAMTTPICANVCQWLETMRNTMIDFLFISILGKCHLSRRDRRLKGAHSCI